jgi:hypothetical protein
MNEKVVVEIIDPNEWQRLRAIRLKSLAINPEAFGGRHEIESAEDENVWREKFLKNDFLIASVDGKDTAMMFIEVLDGEVGAT